jgi:hypothetical protein
MTTGICESCGEVECPKDSLGLHIFYLGTDLDTGKTFFYCKCAKKAYVETKQRQRKTMNEVICKECGEPMYIKPGEGWSETLVGYLSPPGHDHDDNCRSRRAYCSNGHRITVSIRRRCPNPECDWMGKDSCFCHSDGKVDEWPVKPELAGETA